MLLSVAAQAWTWRLAPLRQKSHNPPWKRLVKNQGVICAEFSYYDCFCSENLKNDVCFSFCGTSSSDPLPGLRSWTLYWGRGLPLPRSSGLYTPNEDPWWRRWMLLFMMTMMTMMMMMMMIMMMIIPVDRILLHISYRRRLSSCWRLG